MTFTDIVPHHGITGGQSPIFVVRFCYPGARRLARV
jgi:hypothetical protein